MSTITVPRSTCPNVFDAGLPSIASNQIHNSDEAHGIIRQARQQAPIAMGPYGPEVLSYELVRTVLRNPRFTTAGHCDVVVDLARRYQTPVICALLGAPPPPHPHRRFDIGSDSRRRRWQPPQGPVNRPARLPHNPDRALLELPIEILPLHRHHFLENFAGYTLLPKVGSEKNRRCSRYQIVNGSVPSPVRHMSDMTISSQCFGVETASRERRPWLTGRRGSI